MATARAVTVVAAALLAGATAARAQTAVIAVAPPADSARVVGPFTPEGPRLREQLWLVPTGPGDAPRLRATLFRPPGPGPFPLAVVNHSNASAAIDRIGFSLPTYFFLSRWLVERGFAVLLPLRRGYGGSEGGYAEAIGPCNAPDYQRAGNATADDIEATIDALAGRPFLRAGPALVVGIGGGGWGALALAARAPHKIGAVVGVGIGRGSVGPTKPGEVCAPERIEAAVRRWGAASRVPTLWIHAPDDRSIDIEIGRAMHAAYTDAGGNAAFVATGPVGDGQGHNLLGEFRAIELWRRPLAEFLDRVWR